MQDSKLKIAIYAVLAVVLAVAGYYYYSFLKQKSVALDESTATTISKSLADKKLETDVLKDRKFKELKKIVVEEAVIGEAPKEPSGLKPEDVSKIPRRHSNPFKPF
jgi:hypothetical protein